MSEKKQYFFNRVANYITHTFAPNFIWFVIGAITYLFVAALIKYLSN